MNLVRQSLHNARTVWMAQTISMALFVAFVTNGTTSRFLRTFLRIEPSTLALHCARAFRVVNKRPCMELTVHGFLFTKVLHFLSQWSAPRDPEDNRFPRALGEGARSRFAPPVAPPQVTPKKSVSVRGLSVAV